MIYELERLVRNGKGGLALRTYGGVLQWRSIDDTAWQNVDNLSAVITQLQTDERYARGHALVTKIRDLLQIAAQEGKLEEIEKIAAQLSLRPV